PIKTSKYSWPPFPLAKRRWSADNMRQREETRSSGWPFPSGQQWKVCWRGPARNWGLVIVLGGFGYSDRAGVILIEIGIILTEQELFSPALQSALSGGSENQ